MPFTIDPNAFYSPEEAALILGKKPSTLSKDRSLGTGGLPFVKLTGKKVLYRGADMLALTEGRLVAHGAEYRQRFLAPQE